MMGEDFKFNLCCEELNPSDHLHDHIEHQYEVVSDRKNYYKSNVCSDEFSTGKEIVNHMEIHTGERPFKYKVTGCGMALETESTLIDHINYQHNDERPFKCNFPGCLHSTKTSSNLTAHRRVHSDQRPFACPNGDCSFRSKSKSEIGVHIKCVHSDAKPFACTECHYKTAQSYHLKLHIRRHSSRRDFKCSHPQCTASFKNFPDLKSHLSNRHGPRDVQCDHPSCGRKYSNTKALNAHKRIVHSKESYACSNPECNYNTNIASSLQRHVITHDGKNEKISCPMEGCEYTGKNSVALESHMRRHKRLLVCPVPSCGRYAPSNKALNDHLKLHNPLGRPFQCPLCFKHFTTLQNVQNHCVVHTNEKPYKCGHCEFAAARQATVKTHIAAGHGQIQFPFVVHLLDDRECLRCKLTLPSAQFLLHYKDHEGPVVII